MRCRINNPSSRFILDNWFGNMDNNSTDIDGNKKAILRGCDNSSDALKYILKCSKHKGTLLEKKVKREKARQRQDGMYKRNKQYNLLTKQRDLDWNQKNRETNLTSLYNEPVEITDELINREKNASLDYKSTYMEYILISMFVLCMLYICFQIFFKQTLSYTNIFAALFVIIISIIIYIYI